VILWTRLAPAPDRRTAACRRVVYPVFWEVASDEDFTAVVASGTPTPTRSSPTRCTSTRTGCCPTPGTTTASGRRVHQQDRPHAHLPAADSSPERLRFATVNCQRLRDGYYTPYPHLVKEDIDLVVFLGDYIYENAATGPVRSHGNPEPTTLGEYRVRYALYKGDADLQAAHARCPWVMIWDDHEVENNYAGDISQDGAPDRRVAGPPRRRVPGVLRAHAAAPAAAGRTRLQDLPRAAVGRPGRVLAARHPPVPQRPELRRRARRRLRRLGRLRRHAAGRRAGGSG
jgi:alkaline phosphatase D